MEFDKSRVYTALDADELKIGSKVFTADTLGRLKQYVTTEDRVIDTLSGIDDEDVCCRFLVNGVRYALAYLLSEPKLEWIVYLCRREGVKPYLTACRSDVWESVKETNGAKTILFEGSEDESDKWYTSRRHLANVIAAWEDGKAIQYNSGNGWEDCCDNKPAWDITSQYRVKPEGLKWTDLKIGDIVTNGVRTYMVTGIDSKGECGSHILFGSDWTTDKELENWDKVE